MIGLSCHCGAIRLEADALPESLTSCNCSICYRLGALWAYYDPARVRIVSEPDALISYSWQDRALAFHHCRVCGCATHFTTTEICERQQTVLNARMLPAEAIEGIRIRKFDGARSWTFVDE